VNAVTSETMFLIALQLDSIFANKIYGCVCVLCDFYLSAWGGKKNGRLAAVLGGDPRTWLLVCATRDLSPNHRYVGGGEFNPVPELFIYQSYPANSAL
jgi:hypothetical protein